jgi:hypothetical protein
MRSSDLKAARQSINLHSPWSAGALACVRRPEWLKAMFHVFRAALREIFDESAYERFLARTHGTVSIASYRDFMRERETGMAKRPRCC